MDLEKAKKELREEIKSDLSEIKSYTKELIGQNAKHLSYLNKEIVETRTDLKNHLIVYAKNGKELAKLTEVVKRVEDSLNGKVGSIENEVKKNSDLRTKVNVLWGAVSTIGFGGVWALIEYFK